MKVLTSVAAAERLGWGYRFETRLVAMGPIVNGTLRGDLLVVGGGDPSINPRHPARAAAFDDWARTLKAKGVVHIAGHIVGDDSAVEQPGWGIGWAWDDLVEGYGAAYAALQYHEGEVTVTIGPGATPGAPSVLYLSPANHGLLVDHRAVTGAEGTTPRLTLSREPGTRFLHVDGNAPLQAAPVAAVTAVANPTLYFTDELRATLQRHGIVVDGAAADIDDLSDRPRVGRWHDAARRSVAAAGGDRRRHLEVEPQRVRRGDADGARCHVAGHRGGGDSPCFGRRWPTSASIRAATRPATARACRGTTTCRPTRWWRRWPPPGSVRICATRSRRRCRRPGGAARSPIASKGTPAEGRVRAKTGSMSNVRSLAGFVETAAGEPLAFAFLVNGFDVRASEIDARVDEMLLAMVALPR